MRDAVRVWRTVRVDHAAPRADGVGIRVDAAQQGKFREYGAGDSAVQVPAGYLMKIAALLVEEHQNELFGQTERLGCHTLCGKSHEPWSPHIVPNSKATYSCPQRASMTLHLGSVILAMSQSVLADLGSTR